MSSLSIRAALETALAAMTPSLATAHENAPYTPVAGTPYQHVSLKMARPVSMEQGQRWHRHEGFMDVQLRYPLGVGPGAAQTRAEAICTTFYAGRALTAGSVTVTIDRTPHIAPGWVDEDRYHLPVRIHFWANIRSAT